MGKNSFILCGMSFGDEGKGSFGDYLAFKEDIDCTVRYNGGSHAGHSVITPDGIYHQFSQLGSGMFYNHSKTFLTENMVVNIESLVEEARQFAQKTGETVNEVLDRVFIHKDCSMVTPYHKLLNRLRELSRGSKRHGSVGTGVSEVRFLEREKGLKITVGQIKQQLELKKGLEELFKCLTEFINENEKIIKKNTTNELFEATLKGLWFLTKEESVEYIFRLYMDILNNFRLNICTDLSDYFKNTDGIVCEASQGLLLDYAYGIRPNTTELDTSVHFAVDLLSKLGKENLLKIGILKAFYSRHGMGIFPTEDMNLNEKISDPSQSSSFWNGSIRFGWFDALLTRYAQSINKVDEVYLSSLDMLDSFQEIKVCSEYKYNGELTDEFKGIFEYEEDNDKVIIKNILKNHENLIRYLKLCTPIYKAFKGWNKGISYMTKESELPTECTYYIKSLEKMIGIKVSTISVGPTRNHKIRIGEKNVSI